MTNSNIVFVEVPTGGFEQAEIEKYVRAGFKLWGTVPLKDPNTPKGVLLPGNEDPAVKHLVLVPDGASLPVSLLANYIIRAREARGGLNLLSQQIFGLSLAELETSVSAAKARMYEPNQPVRNAG